MVTFKDWKEIKTWAQKHGFDNLASRIQLNNDCWMSSGKFGRNQVAICDALRFATNESERLSIARSFDKQFSKNYGLY